MYLQCKKEQRLKKKEIAIALEDVVVMFVVCGSEEVTGAERLHVQVPAAAPHCDLTALHSALGAKHHHQQPKLKHFYLFCFFF